MIHKENYFQLKKIIMPTRNNLILPMVKRRKREELSTCQSTAVLEVIPKLAKVMKIAKKNLRWSCHQEQKLIMKN